jgi:hypothetical protein
MTKNETPANTASYTTTIKHNEPLTVHTMGIIQDATKCGDPFEGVWNGRMTFTRMGWRRWLGRRDAFDVHVFISSHHRRR